MPAVNEPMHAPEFHPGAWLNSPPLTLSALRGQVVLVEFWDYTSMNCLRALPYLREWWGRYRAAGFLLIGVHAPRFAFGKNPRVVENAVRELALDFPILLDHELRNWHTWGNRYWPARYLVDGDGCISYFHLGEGDYVGCEWQMQLLLRRGQSAIDFPPPLAPLRLADEPGVVCSPATPELQLGYGRGPLGTAQPMRLRQTLHHTHCGEEQLDTLYLDGDWRHGAEAVTLVAGAGVLAVRYRGKEAAAVLAPPVQTGGRVEVQQDGGRLPSDACGGDVRDEKDATRVHIDTPRLYRLVNNPHFGTFTLRLLFTTPGTSLYALSFLGECMED